MAKERDKQKGARQQKILELVSRELVQTQMDLRARLQEAGFHATQATISRDIRELHIGKAVDANGNYHYIVTQNQENLKRFEMIFTESVVEADAAGNIVLVKCLTGMANAACEVFDRESESWQMPVVGTLSGDNTFLVLTRTEEDAKALCEKLKQYIKTT